MPVGADHERQRQAFTRAQRTKNAGDTLLSQRSLIAYFGSLSGGHFVAELLLLLFVAALR